MIPRIGSLLRFSNVDSVVHAASVRPAPIFGSAAAILTAIVFGLCAPAAAQGSTGQPHGVTTTAGARATSAAKPAIVPSLQGGIAAYEKSDYALARQHLERLTNSRDRAQTAAAWLWLGRSQLAQGQLSQALTSARKGQQSTGKTKLDSIDLAAHALALQGKLDEAIAALKTVQTDPDAHRCRVSLGNFLLMTGQSAQAHTVLMTLIDDYNNDVITAPNAEGLSLVARAAHLLRSAADANDAFNQSERAGEATAQTLLWRGQLFLDKYDTAHAEQVAKQLLVKAPHNADGLVLMAHIKAEQSYDFAAASQLATQALRVNPVHAGAHYVLAGIALRDFELQRAEQLIAEGLRTNPKDLPLLSLRAAARFLAGDKQGFAIARATVLKLNPEYSDLYQIVGEFADWEHRYGELAELMQLAVQLNPQDGKAWAVLGNNLIRLGEEDKGLKALQTAWNFDSFNVRVYNTLNLFENEIPTAYETVYEGPFRFRFPKTQRDLLKRYVPTVLEQAYHSMVKRYGFTPSAPVGIELYSDPQHFAIRTTGLPRIGIQGVCFGRTLASLSPRAAPFNWGNVLWHELGHVFAIQLSKSRVPRWFTEGLSEYETIVRYPDWQRLEDLSLYMAMRNAKLPKVRQFNRAFTHAKSADDITMAYYAAGQMVVFIAETYGMEKINAMLELWSNDLRDEQVVEKALATSCEALDQRFEAWLTPRFARYEAQFVPDMTTDDETPSAARKDPTNLDKQVKWAVHLAREGKQGAAQSKLKEVLMKHPDHALASYVHARFLQQQKNTKEAKRVLEKLIENGHDGYFVRIRLADIAEQNKDIKGAKHQLVRARQFDPMQTAPLRAIYHLAKDSSARDKGNEGASDNEQLSVLRELSVLEQHDPSITLQLLEMLIDKKKWKEAMVAGERAVFVDLHNAKAHYLYALALKGEKHYDRAQFELESALLCEPGAKLKEVIEAERAKVRELGK